MQEGKFESVAAARAAHADAIQQPVVVARPSASDPKRMIKYEIVDKAPSAGSARWERVVAVICHGKKWQFSGYPFPVRALQQTLTQRALRCLSYGNPLACMRLKRVRMALTGCCGNAAKCARIVVQRVASGARLQEAEKGNTVEMFSNLCGFFFHFRDENVPDSVLSWNVKKLVLDRNARHNDAQTALVFFETIVKFLDARKNDAAHGKKGCKPHKLAYK
jgi:RNA pol II accessory factor, Cdc73 family, C-terminal